MDNAQTQLSEAWPLKIMKTTRVPSLKWVLISVVSVVWWGLCECLATLAKHTHILGFFRDEGSNELIGQAKELVTALKHDVDKVAKHRACKSTLDSIEWLLITAIREPLIQRAKKALRMS